MPFVVSRGEWQRIIHEKENETLAETKEAELKRKIKIEKQHEIRIKNKSDQIKREEQKIAKRTTRIRNRKEKTNRITKTNERSGREKESKRRIFIKEKRRSYDRGNH